MACIAITLTTRVDLHGNFVAAPGGCDHSGVVDSLGVIAVVTKFLVPHGPERLGCCHSYVLDRMIWLFKHPLLHTRAVKVPVMLLGNILYCAWAGMPKLQTGHVLRAVFVQRLPVLKIWVRTRWTQSATVALLSFCFKQMVSSCRPSRVVFGSDGAHCSGMHTLASLAGTQRSGRSDPI